MSKVELTLDNKIDSTISQPSIITIKETSVSTPFDRMVSTTGTTVSIETKYITVVGEEIDFQKAKERIREIFRITERKLFYSDLMEMTSYDLSTIIQVCNDLQDEGGILEVM